MASEKRQLKWAVRIENWHPTPLNRLLGAHWTKRSRLKKHDADIVAFCCVAAGVPNDQEHRLRVSLEIILGPKQRGADPDAYWKSLLDALVKCGALKNDSKEWCELGPVSFSRGKRPATRVLLEKLPDAKQKSGLSSRLSKKVLQVVFRRRRYRSFWESKAE